MTINRWLVRVTVSCPWSCYCLPACNIGRAHAHTHTPATCTGTNSLCVYRLVFYSAFVLFSSVQYYYSKGHTSLKQTTWVQTAPICMLRCCYCSPCVPVCTLCMPSCVCVWMLSDRSPVENQLERRSQFGYIEPFTDARVSRRTTSTTSAAHEIWTHSLARVYSHTGRRSDGRKTCSAYLRVWSIEQHIHRATTVCVCVHWERTHDSERGNLVEHEWAGRMRMSVEQRAESCIYSEPIALNCLPNITPPSYLRQHTSTHTAICMCSMWWHGITQTSRGVILWKWLPNKWNIVACCWWCLLLLGSFSHFHNTLCYCFGRCHAVSTRFCYPKSQIIAILPTNDAGDMSVLNVFVLSLHPSIFTPFFSRLLSVWTRISISYRVPALSGTQFVWSYK